MSEKKKWFQRINFIDIFVLLVVVLLIGAVGARYLTNQRSKQEITNVKLSETEMTYTVKVEGIREFTVSALEKKGKVYHTKTKAEIGEIIDVSKSPAKTEAVDVNGQVITTEIPDKFDCLVTIKAAGGMGNKNGRVHAYNSEADEIRMGVEFKINSKWVTCTGLIKSVDMGQLG